MTRGNAPLHAHERISIDALRGHWALVTGASSGIGAEYCRHLAGMGVNLVMVARRRLLLDELSASLIEKHGIRTLVIAIDLSRGASAQTIKEMTTAAGLTVRLLINNAGYGPWGSFEKASAQTDEEIVQLVAATPIALCRQFLPDLESFDGSAVINVSSPAALQPVPYIAVYAAAKACLHNFSLALYGEWQDRGIVVQTVLPAPTATDFDRKGGAYHSELGDARRPASEVVGASLSKLGQDVPVVTNSRDIFKQRAFAGLAPIKLVVREVKKMFTPPSGR